MSFVLEGSASVISAPSVHGRSNKATVPSDHLNFLPLSAWHSRTATFRLHSSILSHFTNELVFPSDADISRELAAARCPLTHDEEEGADEHSAREHVLRAGLLAWRFAHRAQLVGERVGPEVGQQQGTEEEGESAVAGAPRRLHLGAADGLHVELKDGHREDDHPKGQDEGRPRLHFALRASTTREVGGLQQVFRASLAMNIQDEWRANCLCNQDIYIWSHPWLRLNFRN